MNEIRVIRRIFGKKPVTFSCEPIADDGGITNRIAFAKAGIRRYRAVFSDGSVQCFVGKQKSSRIIANGIRMLSGKDLRLLLLLAGNHKIFGYNQSAVREAKLYQFLDASLWAYLPKVMGTAVNCFGSRGFVAMEELSHCNFCMDALYRSIDAIAQFHAKYYGHEGCVKQLGLNDYSAADYRRTRRCIARLFDRLSVENSVCFGTEKVRALHRFIDTIHTEFAAVAHRRTLTHNDFSDRNIYADPQRIAIYDWELACFQNPEHDIVELLISVMTEMSDSEIMEAFRYYRNTLSELTGDRLSDEEYAALLRFNTLEYCVNKLSLLRLAGRHLQLAYPEQLAGNASRLMEILGIV